MRHIGFVILFALAMLLSACGGGSNNNSGTVNGNWTASLMNTDGTPAFAFSTSLSEASNTSTLTVSNFTFTTSGSCFGSADTSETGAFTFSGNFDGNVAGTFQMTITTLFPTQNNVLTLQGTVNGGTITGTWVLTGQTGCSGNGTFTMTQM